MVLFSGLAIRIMLELLPLEYFRIIGKVLSKLKRTHIKEQVLIAWILIISIVKMATILCSF